MSKLNRIQATTYVVQKWDNEIRIMPSLKSQNYTYLPSSFRVFDTREEAEVFIMTNKLSEGAAWTG